jgi:hypothetical protein
MPTVVATSVSKHCCPNCGHSYWSSQKGIFLYLGSPFIKCSFCGKDFVDKDLIKEWRCMTKKEQSFYLRFQCNSNLILLNVIAWIAGVFTLGVLVGFLANIGSGLGQWWIPLIMFIVSSGLSVVCFLISFKHYQNPKKPAYVQKLKSIGIDLIPVNKD